MSIRHRPVLVAFAALAGAVMAALGVSGTASAHITPDPPEAPAGSTLPVGFTVEHGCAGSPTVQLDMRLPAGTTDPTPIPPEGWTGEVTDDGDGGTVVTFAGGPLAPDVEGTFTVEMTLPPTPGVTVYFPFVQRCEIGEIRWIDIPEDGSGDELDEPAPAMLLTASIATTTTAPPATTTTVVGATTASPTTTGAPATAQATTTIAPDTTPAPTEAITTTEPVEPTTTIENTDDGDDDGSSTAWIIAGAIAGVVVIGGGATWLVRRGRS